MQLLCHGPKWHLPFSDIDMEPWWYQRRINIQGMSVPPSPIAAVFLGPRFVSNGRIRRFMCNMRSPVLTKICWGDASDGRFDFMVAQRVGSTRHGMDG